MNNTGLLAVLIVILLGITTIALVQSEDETPAEAFVNDISSNIEELGEEIADEIDDHTDAR